MAAAASNPSPPDLHSLSIRMPRPLWIGIAAVLVIGAAVGISIGVPIYRQCAAIDEINRRGGGGEVRYDGPQFDRLYVADTQVTDAGVADLQAALPRLAIKR